MKLISYIVSIFAILYFNNIYSKEISFSGLTKLNFNDLQTLSNIDLSRDNYTIDEINSIIQDLYKSDLISDINFEILEDFYSINVTEAKRIENIYVNGNIQFKDDDIITNLLSRPNFLFNKNNIKKDINLIKEIYLSSGYYDISVSSSYENFSEDKINLIFNIYEGNPYQISQIDFKGNKYFSDKFLANLITSRTLSFINIFTSGSNFNSKLFNFDKNKIITKYKEKGFFNVNVTHEIIQLNDSRFKLIFYIEENDRLFLSKIVSDFDDFPDEKYDIFFNSLKNNLKKNNFLYDKKIIDDELDKINQNLIDINEISYSYQAAILEEEDNFYLSIYKNKEKQTIINKINIEGNSITRDKVLRSKITLEPGDYLLNHNKTKSLRRLNRLKYINSVKISEVEEQGSVDLDIEIDENKKTGNFLLAGSFSGDTGLGFAIGLSDYNILGSGNELNSTFNINAEQARFAIDYKEYLINNPTLTNNYSVFNIDNDLTDSFGFKSEERGIGYKLGYDYSEKVNMSFGIKYNHKKNHSGINTNNFIQENIGNFNQFTLNYFLIYDSTNDIFYPSNGMLNKINLEISPNSISDDSYFKLKLNNDVYFGSEEKESFFFISNRIGLADSFNNNLKTTNAFSLGGLNFKGFDYRGVGPTNGNIYLGGNNFYTVTLGYGSQFLFDKKDNINFRSFVTSGSIWGSDYSSNNNFKNRVSTGISIDILTAVFPISFTYAIPLQKEDADKERRFNFTIGTSFWSDDWIY